MNDAVTRLLYSLIFYLALPLILLRLCWRARRQPEYLQHLRERFALYPSRAPTNTAQPIIWLHAVSVGETRAAFPLIEALLHHFPQHLVLLTHMTPTGRQAAQEIIARYPSRIHQLYLPYDLPGAGRRFLAHYQPRIGLLMETEIWPNLLASARRQSVPVVLVNARLSERSARGYARIAALSRPAFASLTAAAAQSDADAQRLRAAGATTVEVCGNLKFDLTIDEAKQTQGARWKAAIGARPVWLAASTREGEEALILDAVAGKTIADKALLVIVPRHPQRFDEVAALLDKKGIRYQRRSRELPAADVPVWLGDSMGEMALYYTVSDLALIGGSLLPFGGQNLIEAAACGCPVLIGPHTFNFAQATRDAVACGAAIQLPDSQTLPATLHTLFSDTQARQAMSHAARRFAAAHRGATARIVALIGKILQRRSANIR